MTKGKGLQLSSICGNVNPIAPEADIHTRVKGPGGRTEEHSPASMCQPWGHPAACGDRAHSACGSAFEQIQEVETGASPDELLEQE